MAEPLRRRIRAKFLRAASASTGALPEWFARGGLESAAWLSRFTRFEGRTLDNLELAYGEELSSLEKANIAAGVRKHSARIFYEWLRLSRGGDREASWLDSMVECDDSIELLEAEVRKGRGVLVVTPHLGNWELLAATIRRRGIKGAVVGLERRNDPASRWLSDMRRGYGVETIPQHSHPRALVQVLEEGGTLGLLCDLEVRRLTGEFLPFFGRPALTMTAPAALARSRRLPLVPVRCVLPSPHAAHYVLSVEEPLERDWALPRQEATAEHMTRVNAVFERWIRESPEQWAWHQARWRTRPDALQAR
jgi:Kdo2-lipid IVA lauroyltransferase/acyltransferase